MWLIEEMLVASKFIRDERKEYEILILTGFERNSVLWVCLVAWRQAAQAESRECSVNAVWNVNGVEVDPVFVHCLFGRCVSNHVQQ